MNHIVKKLLKGCYPLTKGGLHSYLFNNMFFMFEIRNLPIHGGLFCELTWEEINSKLFPDTI